MAQIMQTYPQSLIIRHRKENLKKCSLRGLEAREDMQFSTYPFTSIGSLEHYVVLVMEGAKELSMQDADQGIVLLDSTWRYLPKMVQALQAQGSFEKRTLPSGYRTAYPRKQGDCVDPERGLSSLEALFISYRILGREADSLLNHYYWKESFLEINSKLFSVA